MEKGGVRRGFLALLRPGEVNSLFRKTGQFLQSQQPNRPLESGFATGVLADGEDKTLGTRSVENWLG